MSVTEAPVEEAVAPTLVGSSTAPGHRRRRRWGIFAAYLGTLFLLMTLNFALARVLPGDPIKVLTGLAGTSRGATSSLNPETQAKLVHYYGLDRPLVDQYGTYLSNLAHGDLGTSIKYNQSVSTLMVGRVGWTMLLVLSGVGLATVVGVAAGVHSGWRRGRRLDQGLLGLFVGISSFPIYVLASFALILLAVKLGWFPLAGAQDPFNDYGPAQRVLDVLHHLLLPAMVMAVQFLFLQYLVMRGGMVSELGADYLVLGRAKGLSERTLKYHYAGRNAMLPAVTVLAINVGGAIATSVFVERIFAWPGIGRLMFDSISARDYPVMQACFLVVSFLVLTVNLASDLLYPKLDPRVRT